MKRLVDVPCHNGGVEEPFALAERRLDIGYEAFMHDHDEDVCHLLEWLQIDRFDRRAVNRRLAQLSAANASRKCACRSLSKLTTTNRCTGWRRSNVTTSTSNAWAVPNRGQGTAPAGPAGISTLGWGHRCEVSWTSESVVSKSVLHVLAE